MPDLTSSSSTNSRLLLIGDAPGADEIIKKSPFAGAVGRLLNDMLRDAGIENADVANIFDVRPPGGKIEAFFGAKKSFPKEHLVHKFKTKYLLPEHWSALERIRNKIKDYKVVMPMGAVALWALTGDDGISKKRGTIVGFDPLILPTFHPGAVLHEYSHRPIVTSDFAKARRYLVNGYVPTKLEILVPQTKADLIEMFERLRTAPIIAFDVETIERQIECISLAADGVVFCVSIMDDRQIGGSAWSFDSEIFFWDELAKLFAAAPKVLAHNSTYDLTYLRQYGIVPGGEIHDTTLLHHALEPEMRKSLGFLASLYLDAPEWKSMRVKSQKDVDKADE